MTDAGSSAAHAGVELAEVLESETHVDMEKMLSLAHAGVPDDLRAEAWKYMLGVSRPERAEEMSLRKRMETEHKENERAWRSRPHGELARAVKAEVLPHRQALGQSCARVEVCVAAGLGLKAESRETGGGA